MTYEELAENVVRKEKLDEYFGEEDQLKILLKEFKLFLEKSNKTPQYVFRNLIDFRKMLLTFFLKKKRMLFYLVI